MTDTVIAPSPKTGAPVTYRRSLQDALELTHGVDAVAAQDVGGGAPERKSRITSEHVAQTALQTRALWKAAAQKIVNGVVGEGDGVVVAALHASSSKNSAACSF